MSHFFTVNYCKVVFEELAISWSKNTRLIVPSIRLASAVELIQSISPLIYAETKEN